MRHQFLVSGLVNWETDCRVDGFPIDYAPIHYNFFGVSSCVSGVGCNVAKALSTLGVRVTLATLLGQDLTADIAMRELTAAGIDCSLVQRPLKESPASAVLYDREGRRRIYCDLKDIQETAYDFDGVDLSAFDAVVACNINFSRPLLDMAKKRNKLIATDVHVLSNPDDDYNRDFMRYADILFLSDEGISWDKKDFLRALGDRYHNQVIVLGMGAKGAMLYMPHQNVIVEQPACHVDNVKNTVGAGDALFSAYLHYHLSGLTPVEALRRAQMFASLKIRSHGAADGFVTPDEIEKNIH